MQKRTRGNADDKKSKHGWEKRWNQFCDGWGQSRKMRREWAEYKQLRQTPLDSKNDIDYIDTSSNGDTMEQTETTLLSIETTKYRGQTQRIELTQHGEKLGTLEIVIHPGGYTFINVVVEPMFSLDVYQSRKPEND